MDRRQFVGGCTGALVLGGLAGPARSQNTRASSSDEHPKPPFTVLYNNDTTNTMSCVSPWHKKGEPFREELLAASIDEVAGMGVDAYLLSPGLGWIPWWQSDVYGDHYEWWMQTTGLEPDTYGQYMLDGGDMVRVLIDRCRAGGMAPFVSLRLNDVHNQEYFGEKLPKSIWSSRFYVEHPEYLLDPDHKTHRGYYAWRGQNWAIPEVREHKLAFLKELAGKYELAGLELDFLRDHHLFRLDETTEEQRIEFITEFVAEVRRALDANSGSGDRRHLCVRIPLQVARHGEVGLDVSRLAEVGVDMFNPSGWYHTTQRADIGQIRDMAPRAAIYHEMTHVTGSLRLFVEEKEYTTSGFPRTSDEQFYTTAHLALQREADGVSFFNFVYFREHSSVPARVINEPPFHVLRHVSDPTWLARQPQYYWLSQSVYHSQLPREIQSNEPQSFVFDLAPPSQPRKPNGRLRIHATEPFGDARLSVKMNGALLVATGDTSAFYGNPYDVMLSDSPRRRAWVVPAGILRNGLNELKVTLTSPPRLKIHWIDLACE